METIIRCGRGGNWANPGLILRHADGIVAVLTSRVVELSFSRLRTGEHCPEQHHCPWLLEIHCRPATDAEAAAFLIEDTERRARIDGYRATLAAKDLARRAATKLNIESC